ncbi:hypothetical protein [Agreia sp. COWG]|uniref:hypothetical protein n=1 Tax=Agreia sp. COWG TaxID=2773266 RepID=UPI0019252F53|nr:hypothetical protein [Agreia sp. COWG]CAD6006445.1 conserved membrane protein of unknown function [Agreia sp. COWG]
MNDRDTERWMRYHGLPYFVRRRARSQHLLARTAPFLVAAVAFDVLSSVAVDLTLDPDTATVGDLVIALVALALVVAVPVVPIVLGLWSARLLRTRAGAKTPVAIVALLLYLLVEPLCFGLIDRENPVWGALQNAGVTIGALALTWLGIGALLAWASRAALRQLGALGQLATRALPILMLVVVFAFFARALWEVTSSMSGARLLGVALFFLVLGLLFTIPIMRSEMAQGEHDSISGTPLSKLERFNLAVVMVLAQAFQVAFFALLVCVFLLALGHLAFSPEVLDRWLGSHAGNAQAFGIELPVRVGMVKTAVFLSCVSSLNFLVSVSTAAAYKSAFYDPLLAEVREALAVRAEYRSRAA